MIIFNSQEDMYLEDTLSMFSDGQCCVYGTINGWDGSHELFATKKTSLFEAVNYATAGGDDFTIDFINGSLEIISTHHDGANLFVIRLLNNKGQKRFENCSHILSSNLKGYMFKKIKAI